jgi:hypothetical protein
MDCKIVNPSNGRSGGVILFWKKEIKVEQKISAPKYIDVRIREKEDKIWRLTGLYGEPRWEDKYKTWDKLRELNQSFNLPWVIIGDFNEILYSHEKEGGNPRRQGCMQGFRDALVDCGLEDIGHTGDPFTWRRGRIRERLDRAVANGAWSIMHPGATLLHLEFTRSDYRPILLDTDYQQPQVSTSTKPKRFEARWLKEKNFHEKVQQTWEAVLSTNSGSVLDKLGRLHSALHECDASVLKQPRKQIRKAQEKLDMDMNGPMNDENEAIAKEMAALIDLLLELEETHWMQRSRANWLNHGDRNTTFFHNFASARRKKNFIKKLKDGENWVEGTDALKPLIFDYFNQLFSSEVNQIDLEMLEKVPVRVTDNMNERLLSPFTAEEVKIVAFSIGDFKAPGPDGLHAVFYKKF